MSTIRSTTGLRIAAVVAVVAAATLAFGARADAAVPHLTTTSLDCPDLVTYGVPATCTVTVTDVTPFVTRLNPTGTASVGTILDRLQISDSPCTLAPVPSSSDSSSCQVTATPIDVGHFTPGAAYSPTGVFVASVGVDLLMAAQPAPLTITANDHTRDYGSANPSLDATYAGFVLGQGPGDLVGTLACTTTATAASPTGGYPVTCSGQTSPKGTIVSGYADLYDITYVAGTLTVAPAPLTVTATDASRLAGQANPTLGATVTGFVNGETVADLGGTLACTTTATAASPTGGYPVTCSGYTSSNYDIAYVPGTLTVLAAPSASVTAGSDLVPGGHLGIDAAGWAPGSSLSVTACGAPLGTATVAADGTVAASFDLPRDLTPGPCDVVVAGTDQLGAPASQVLAITIAAAPVTPSGTLPYTGADVAPLVGVALVALIGGAALALLGRRHRA